MADSGVPTGYKQTEVGVIPKDWDVKKLGDILKINHGKSQHDIEKADGKYPILATGGEIGRTNCYLYDKPSVMIGRKGTIDKPRYTESPFWTVDTLFYTDVFDNTVPKYVFYKFNTIDWYSYNEASGVPSLNAKTIENIRVALPPTIEEQSAIATILSDTDALIEHLEELIAKKIAIKQGAMQQLLTGKKRLPGFEGEWEVGKIKNISSITTGGKNTQDKIDDAEYPFFVRSSIVERINSYSFDGEAVLTAGDGVGTGKVFHYINDKFDFHQRVYKISDFDEKMDGYFFYLFFSNYFLKRIMAMTAKSSVDSVRMEMIAEMPIPLPPRSEQKAIATILSDMDTEIEALEQKQAKYKSIKQGMMQELLTGKTRLV